MDKNLKLYELLGISVSVISRSLLAETCLQSLPITNSRRPIMGAHLYWYFTPYHLDFNVALQSLREREFEAGRYSPAVDFPEFPITKETPSPGKAHGTIEEALEAAMEEGTRSILDIQSVSNSADSCTARILSDDELSMYFGTTKPSRQDLEDYDNLDPIIDAIERGEAVCIPVFENNRPTELFFAGYSFD